VLFHFHHSVTPLGRLPVSFYEFFPAIVTNLTGSAGSGARFLPATSPSGPGLVLQIVAL